MVALSLPHPHQAKAARLVSCCPERRNAHEHDWRSDSPHSGIETQALPQGIAIRWQINRLRDPRDPFCDVKGEVKDWGETNTLVSAVKAALERTMFMLEGH